MEPHLEYIPRNEMDLVADTECNWEWKYTDYDGSLQSAPCTAIGDVWVTFETYYPGSRWEQPSMELEYVRFCRAHGNLVLIEMREDDRKQAEWETEQLAAMQREWSDHPTYEND